MLKCYVGIDEVGYGPILGPLVIGFIPVVSSSGPDEFNNRINEFLAKNDLITIQDSKVFFKGKNKHLKLELEILGFLSLFYNPYTYYREFLRIFLRNKIMWEKAIWLDPNLKVPFFLKEESTSIILDKRSAYKRCFITPVSRIHKPWLFQIEPYLFNRMLESYDTKSELITYSVCGWIRRFVEINAPDYELTFYIGRHGGRKFYQRHLYRFFEKVQVIEEKDAYSHYHVYLDGLLSRLIFITEAEKKFALVALASMVAKYFRELSMHCFNQFWQKYKIALKPTSGYLPDALGFVENIKDVAQKLNIDMAEIVRKV